MKTAHYTFTVWDRDAGALAAGFDGAVDQERQAMLLQAAGTPAGDENKVIDLTAWLEANQDEDREAAPDWTCGEDGDADEAEPVLPAPRPRRSHQSMLTAELVSTISVVAVAAAIILRILTF